MSTLQGYSLVFSIEYLQHRRNIKVFLFYENYRRNNQPTTNQMVTEGPSRSPTFCLANPALTASRGSVRHTLKYNWDRAYVDEFPIAVEDLDVGKLRTIVQGAIGLMRRHNFGWKAFWDSKPDWSCLRLRLAANFRQSCGVAMPGKVADRVPLFARLYPGIRVTNEGKINGEIMWTLWVPIAWGP